MNVLAKWLTLRGKIIASTIVFLSIGVIFLSFQYVWSEHNTLHRLDQSVANTITKVKRRYPVHINRVKTFYQAAISQALKKKVYNYTQFFANVAISEIRTSDLSALNRYCQWLGRDPDIVMAYIRDASGKLLTSSRNDKHEHLVPILKKHPQASVSELDAYLTRSSTIIKVQKGVMAGRERLGQVVVIAALASGNRPMEALQDAYYEMESDLFGSLSGLRSNIQRQIATKIETGGVRSVLIGLCTIILTVALIALATRKVVQPANGIISDIYAKAEVLNGSAANLSDLSSHMALGVQEMAEKSNNVSTAAKQMSSQMITVADSMDQTSSNVNMVAGSIEEMTATINEIATNSEKAREITGEAVSQSKMVSEKVDKLGRTMKEIGKITDVITQISEQTNLLALNATIEASRAGVAGKGFAVVANEIKELAKQTAEETLQISSQIEEIQGSTYATVADISHIANIINDVNEIVSTIAASVEEQSVTTREIADNVTQASAGISDMNQHISESSSGSKDISLEISEVSLSAEEVAENNEKVKLSSDELITLAKHLKKLVDALKL